MANNLPPGSYPHATGSTSLAGLMQTWRDKRALEMRREDVFAYWKLAPEVRPIPRGEGKSVQFYRWKPMTRVDTTITEGHHPASSGMSVETVSCAVVQKVQWTVFTDLLSDTSIGPVEQAAINLLGYSMWQSLDYYLQQKFWSTAGTGTATSVAAISSWGFPIYGAANAARMVVSGGHSCHLSAVGISVISPTYIRRVVAELKKLKVKPFKGGKFKGIVHTTVASQMRGNPELKTFMVNHAGAPAWLEKGDTEAGFYAEIEGVAFYETADCQEMTTGVSTVWPTLIYGRGAYGRTFIAGAKRAKQMEILIKHSGPQDTSNPANLYSTGAWKATFGALILENDAGLVLLCKRPTANPL